MVVIVAKTKRQANVKTISRLCFACTIYRQNEQGRTSKKGKGKIDFSVNS